MATLIEECVNNFTIILDDIVTSNIYTDIKAMYTDGTLQKDQYDKILIAFHDTTLDTAAAKALSLAEKGYRLDDIIDANLRVKEQQKQLTAAKKLTEIENTTLRDRDAFIIEQQKQLTAAKKTTEMENTTLRYKDKLFTDRKTSLISKQTETEGHNTIVRYKDKMIVTEKAALAFAKAAVQRRKTTTEEKRKLLMEAQALGFEDNVKIEFNKSLSESIGMIMSGGNIAPTSLFAQFHTSVTLLNEAASRDPIL